MNYPVKSRVISWLKRTQNRNLKLLRRNQHNLGKSSLKSLKNRRNYGKDNSWSKLSVLELNKSTNEVI